MLFEKNLLGQQTVEGFDIRYYLVHQNEYFGVAIEEGKDTGITCYQEVFTEDYEEAYRLGFKLHRGQVTGITLTEIIDDYVQ